MIKLALAATLWLLTGWQPIFFKHDFHSSIAEMTYNPRSKAFEVKLRVFTDDLEQDMGKFLGKKYGMHLGKDLNDDPDIIRYIHTYFYFLDRKGRKKDIVYIAKVVQPEVVEIFFEIPFKEKLEGFYLHNSIMLNLFDDQFNIVHLSYQDQKTSFLFKNGQRQIAVKF